VVGARLDTNVYVSALQFGGIAARLIGTARAGIIRLDTSDAILDETIGVLRDKFGWKGYELHFARLQLQKATNRVQPTRKIEVADDPDDDRILECAAQGRGHCGCRPGIPTSRDAARTSAHATGRLRAQVDIVQTE
jgi:predicted nucleic acid-binding protein